MKVENIKLKRYDSKEGNDKRKIRDKERKKEVNGIWI